MKLSFRAGIAGIVGLAALASCSGSGGGGILDNPGGDIVIRDALTGNVLNTSANSPYFVSNLRFTITATESHFAGPYDVKIISETNVATASNGQVPYGFSFNEPCFSTTEDATLTVAAVPITFSGSNANGEPSNFPVGGLPTPGPGGVASTQTGNPCHSGEFEVATISDSDGHTVKFYYEEYP